MSTGPVVTAWAAVSPFGTAPGDLAEGLRRGVRPLVRVDGDPAPAGGPVATDEVAPSWSGLPVPQPWAGLVPGFDVRVDVGPKGTRTMDRLTALAVAATGRLVGGPAVPGAPPRLPGVGDDTSVVLGTDSGSVASMTDFTRESLVNERPYFVQAARFPNVTMNGAAAQMAIRHTLRGPNVTVAGGRIAGLQALQYARRLHRAGRAGVVVCGAVEEYTPARAWLAHHSGLTGPLAEGCAVLLLESPASAREHGRRPLASVAGLAFGVAPGGRDARPRLAGLVERVLKEAGAVPAAVGQSVTTGGSPVEREAVRDVLGDAADPVDTTDLFGDLGGAGSAFGLVVGLELAARGPGPAGGVLVTALDRDGGLGCALLLGEEEDR